MKKITLLLVAGVLMNVFLAMFNESSAQTKAPAWDYPVKPGTPEWATFLTHAEKVAAIQVPEDVLNALTTEELVEVCLNYPLYGDIFAYNSLQDGLRQNILVCSNGIRELYRRPDNAQHLFDALKNSDLLEIESHYGTPTQSPSGDRLLKLMFLETLTSHESVLTNAEARRLREIAAIATRNMLIKERGNVYLYSNQCLGSSAYLLATILNMEDKLTGPSPDLDRFLKTGASREVLLLVEELMNSYVRF